jgi:two-component system, cell cycle sensor histidine kinase and response regulator CckA
MAEHQTIKELEKRIEDLERECLVAKELSRENEERYKALYNRSFDMVYIHDFQGRFLDVNDATIAVLGYPREDISALTLESILSDDQIPQALLSIQELRETGSQKKSDEFTVRCKDGSVVWLETKASVIYRGGQPYAIQGIARDITERKLAEEFLRQQEEHYRTIFENTGTASIIIGEDTIIRLANANFEKLSGYTKEEIEGKMSWTVFISAEDLEKMKIYHDLRRKDAESAPNSYEFRFKNRSGDLRDIFLSVGIMPGSCDSIASLADITESKRAKGILLINEEKYREILESIDEGYYELDLTGNFTFFNRTGCRMLGYEYDEMLGMNYRTYLSDENAKFMFEVFHRIYMTGNPELLVDYEVICKDGSTRVHEMNASLMRGTSGEPAGFRIMGRDVTDRKRAEEALRVSEERYRGILENMEEAYFEVDLKGDFMFFNSTAVTNLGYTNDEMKGMNFRKYVDLENADKVFEFFHKVYVTGEPIKGFDWEITKKNGEKVAVESSVALRRDNEGRITGFKGVVRDISKRKKAEDALKASEERYRTIFESTATANIIVAEDTTILLANSNFEQLSGYTRQELEGKMSWTGFVVDDDRERMKSYHYQRRLDGSIPSAYEFRIVNRKGEVRDLYMSVSMIPETKDSVASIMDVTERIKTVQALKDSEERFRDLAELLPETVFEEDLEGRLTFVNRRGFDLFGFTVDDFKRGVSAFDVIAEEHHDTVRNNMKKAFSGEKVGLKEYTARKSDGATFSTMIHTTPIIREGKPVGLRGFLIDITERKNLEEQLTRAQKMEAIGTLAGGIAHDFNNLLMGILGNVSLVLMNMDVNNPLHDRLKNIEEYVKRGSDLTKQLLGFALGGKYEVKPTDIGEFIRRSSDMFGRTKKEIRIHRKAQETLWTVEVDRGQMEQVLLNLFVNAWQAMPSGGDLYLSAENVHLKEAEVSPYDLNAGKYVKITVTDTGVGMDEATKARIFEPFFTTKERGRGTGLGLASVYGIVKNHGGIVHVESEKEVGTSFMIYLPASARAVENEKKAAEDMHKGRETILLIDDEEMILDVGSQLLTGLGYAVMTAKGGKNGVEIFSENREKIDLVILDIIMPDIGGSETFDRLRDVYGEVKVLLSSGYSLDGQAKEIMEKGCKGFIQKPFTMEALSKRIREILEKEEQKDWNQNSEKRSTAGDV